jgi:hypothetical protein
MSIECGYTLIEILFLCGLLATIAAATIPQTLSALDGLRTASAARWLTARMASARTQAVMRSAHVAIRFVDTPSGITLATFVDGNGNGVRNTDIDTLVDRACDTPIELADLFPGVDIGVSGTAGSDPVRLGSSNLLSFTPNGTATSGSIYVRGRRGSQYVVRVLGATGRARIQRYVEATRRWTDTW